MPKPKQRKPSATHVRASAEREGDFERRVASVPTVASGTASRKAKRKEKRAQKKKNNQQYRVQQKQQKQQQQQQQQQESKKRKSTGDDDPTSSKRRRRAAATPTSELEQLRRENERLKAQLKRTAGASSASGATKRTKRVHFEETPVSATPTPAPRDRAKDPLASIATPEDAELERLAKLLGMSHNDSWHEVGDFMADGFGDLLTAIDNPAALPDSDDEFHEQQQQQQQDSRHANDSNFEDSDTSEPTSANGELRNEMDEEEEDNDHHHDEKEEYDEDNDDNSNDDQSASADSDSSHNSSGDGTSAVAQDQPVRKYIAPHLRAAAAAPTGDADDNGDAELARSVTRLVNRLAASNVAQIYDALDGVFNAHSRHATSVALAREVRRVCETTALSTTLGIAIAELTGLLGALRGVECTSPLFETLAAALQDGLTHGRRKEAQNFVMLWSCLYRTGSVAGVCVGSVLSALVARFDDIAVELALLLLQQCGAHLRRDEPRVFKDVVLAMQEAATAVGDQLSTRARYMVDAVAALKDNRKRHDDALGELAADARRRLMRVLGERGGRPAAPLRATWPELCAAETGGGRWWLVGAAWAGDGVGADHAAPPGEGVARTLAGANFDARLLQLARAERMNSDVRRAVFCSIVGSDDYMDASERLARLGLRGKQERDVVFVLLHCAARERQFNPFYGHLAVQLCSDKKSRTRLALQYAYWDRLRELATLKPRALVNLAQLAAQLLLRGALRVAPLLKVLDWGALDAASVLFLRACMRALLHDASPTQTQQLFGTLLSERALRSGLTLFLANDFRRHVKTLLADDATKADASVIARRLRVALHCLTQVEQDLDDGRGEFERNGANDEDQFSE